jgi:hypothetical protein
MKTSYPGKRAGKLSSKISLYEFIKIFTRNIIIIYMIDTLNPFELKGQCHEMDIFVQRSKHFSSFCTCANGFQGLSNAFHYPIQLLQSSLLFFKLLTNFEYAYTETILRVPFFVTVRCSILATSHGLQEKCVRINLCSAQPSKNGATW